MNTRVLDGGRVWTMYVQPTCSVTQAPPPFAFERVGFWRWKLWHKPWRGYRP